MVMNEYKKLRDVVARAMKSQAIYHDDQEYFEFLDALRETGATNMFGAASYLRDEYPELSKQEARQILMRWMDTYSDRHPR